MAKCNQLTPLSFKRLIIVGRRLDRHARCSLITDALARLVVQTILCDKIIRNVAYTRELT